MELSQQQRAVAELIVDGLTNKQIGQRMGVGVKTVASHRLMLYRKLQVHNAAQLVRTLAALNGNSTHGVGKGGKA